MTWLDAVTAGVAIGAAALGVQLPARLLPGRPARPRTGSAEREPSGPVGPAPSRSLTLSGPDVADLADRLAAMACAGIPARQWWDLLAAATHGPQQRVCRVVAAMVAAGGSASQGLALLARPPTGARHRWVLGVGPPRRSRVPTPAISWLAATFAVVERTGAPVAEVLAQAADAVRAEQAAAAAREVALAGPRATAAVLTVLPVAALAVVPVLGVDPARVLVGTGAGRACLVTGLAMWACGVWWAASLVDSARRAGG